jgi:hypothetical protein
MRKMTPKLLRRAAPCSPLAVLILTGSIFFRYNGVSVFSRYTKVIEEFSYSSLVSQDVSVIRRSSVTRDEFYKKRLSDEAVEEYFRFNPSLYSEENFRLEPMWTCSDMGRTVPDRQKKLIFVQMSRSAGSTIRALLRGYASYCKAGIAIVTNCIDLGLEHMNGIDRWINGRSSVRSWQDCYLSYAANRTGYEIPVHRVSSMLLEYIPVDILAGHIPIGSDECWSNGKGEHVDVQYVVFFRHPIDKYVSEIMFLHKDQSEMSIGEAVDLLNKTITTELTTGNYHEKYSNHLITPEQKEWAEKEGVRWLPERRTNLSLINLFSKKVLVGIVERMPQSLQLLEFVMDGRKDIPSMFRFFSSDEKIFETKNRTDEIVERIRQDLSMTRMIQEYLKYELQIYQHAMLIHKKQYSWITASTSEEEASE